MKIKGVFFAFFLLLILSSFLSTAANETEAKAYSCLESKVENQCSTLSTEEKIFSLLTIERCKSEVLSDSLSDECWPGDGCEIKTTSQAILALRHVNTDTTEAENWLLSQTGNFKDIDWLLQVEAEGETSCTASYGGGSYRFIIRDDKELNTNAGSCLTVKDDYWFMISSSCYDYEFEISCENSFLTSLLYKKKTSPTLYISKTTTRGSAEGTNTEKVSASCLVKGGSCDYEGTLWGAVVLKSRGHDTSSYIPYLVVVAEENSEYIPEAFLHSLTNNFRAEVLTQQIESKYWSASGDKFYDTAVALLPFQSEQLSEKTSSKAWLAEVQEEDGCWQGSILNTAFLLYSIWPKKATSVPTAKDCEDSGYDCMSSASCLDAEGSVLTDYTGCEINVCCSKPQVSQTCSQQGGELCDSDEDCLGGDTVSASDASGGETCCIDGECRVQERSECEIQGGFCRSLCSEGEEFNPSYSCSFGNCCVAKEKSNALLIVILAVLIILVLLGIIFRKKLREFFIKIKSKFGKGKGKKLAGGPRFPPSSRVYPGAVQRRILPGQPRQPARKPVQKKSEFDDVLKKLKEIGK